MHEYVKYICLGAIILSSILLTIFLILLAVACASSSHKNRCRKCGHVHGSKCDLIVDCKTCGHYHDGKCKHTTACKTCKHTHIGKCREVIGNRTEEYDGFETRLIPETYEEDEKFPTSFKTETYIVNEPYQYTVTETVTVPVQKSRQKQETAYRKETCHVYSPYTGAMGHTSVTYRDVPYTVHKTEYYTDYEQRTQQTTKTGYKQVSKSREVPATFETRRVTKTRQVEKEFPCKKQRNIPIQCQCDLETGLCGCECPESHCDCTVDSGNSFWREFAKQFGCSRSCCYYRCCCCCCCYDDTTFRLIN